MAENNVQYKIGEKEMEKLRKGSKNAQKEEKKETVSAGTVIFRVCRWVIAVAYFALLLFGKRFLPQEGMFLSSLDLFSGAENPNHLIRIVSLCILTLSISAILQFIIDKMANNKNITKKTGRAIIELLGNLVKYVAYIVLIFLILNAMGVNTAELLAGLGILGLIIGLGVTSLIEDIVAGIFIIAEHTFDVGDIIVLDGYRGTVVSIGIRSTKIADIGGDILTVRNSSIGSVVNLTDRVSCAALTIPLAPQESLERVETVIKNAHIGDIAEKYSDIMEGAPLYLGLCDITKKGVQMLLFIAACNEEKRYDVERALYHEIKTIFDNNNIQLGAPGIEE
jgi:small conductance mechanosensitive channel